jgi:hypothetical protein
MYRAIKVIEKRSVRQLLHENHKTKKSRFNNETALTYKFNNLLSTHQYLHKSHSSQ